MADAAQIAAHSNPRICADCRGTGRDEARTQVLARRDAEFRYRVRHHGTYVRCRTCNGNGLDPAEAFGWGRSQGGVSSSEPEASCNAE